MYLGRVARTFAFTFASGLAMLACGDEKSCEVIDDFAEDDLECASEVREITGNLELSGSSDVGGERLVFPQLERVGGDVFTGSRVVVMRKLESVGGMLYYSDPGGYNVGIMIDLPALVEVEQDFIIVQYTGLIGLSIPLLERVGGTFALQSLAHIQSISAPALLGTGGDLSVSSYSSSDDPGWLKEASFDSLEEIGGALEVNYNVDLVTLSLPTLKRVGGGIKALENPKLSQCDFEELAERVGQTCECSMNGGADETCS